MSANKLLLSFNKNLLIKVVTLLLVGVTFYSLLIATIDPLVLRISHLFLAIIIIFLNKPLSYKYGWILDYIGVVLAIVLPAYLIHYSTDLLMRIVVNPTSLDVLIGVMCLILTMEAARRALGIFFYFIIILFISYAKYGYLIPGILGHNGYGFSRIMGFLQTTDGIYSIPLGVSATYVLLFVVFGAFLNSSGAGQLFIDLSLRVAGSARGGPAKVAVIASSLFGSISGAAVANVVSTGIFTIPLMKKIGYQAKYAGAIEAVSSTGGQIIPPVMGAAAFVMADILGIPYAQIMVVAIIPAILYYAAVFFMVDALAIKANLHSLPKKDLPDIKKILTSIYLIAPLIVFLFILLVVEQSVIRGALWGIVVTIIVSWFKKPSRMGIKKILEAIYEGGTNVVVVAIACASAGVVIGIFSLTGLGVKVGNIILSLSGESLATALVLSALLSLILGMGLPTVAAYIVSASVIVPSLTQMGIEPLVAHLFVFYYATISTITPPVCVASFAASGIANESVGKVSYEAFKLGAAAYIIPFMFIYTPQLLLMGSTLEIILRVCAALFGIYMLSTALTGCYPFLFKRIDLNLLQRSIFIFAAFMFVTPVMLYELIGVGLCVLGIIIGRFTFSKAKDANVDS